MIDTPITPEYLRQVAHKAPDSPTFDLLIAVANAWSQALAACASPPKHGCQPDNHSWTIVGEGAAIEGK